MEQVTTRSVVVRKVGVFSLKTKKIKLSTINISKTKQFSIKNKKLEKNLFQILLHVDQAPILSILTIFFIYNFNYFYFPFIFSPI